MAENRVVVLVDMDCFYCQVEVRHNPEHKGKPLAVVQYNPWRGGGIIAVNYEARDKGVKRGMRGDDAKKVCPDIVLCTVAEFQGKADLAKYRDAGREVVEVLHEFTNCIQVASIDESYMDITEAVEERMLQISEVESGIPLAKLPSTFVIGYSDDKSNDEGKRVSGLENWLKCLSETHCWRLAVGALIVEEMRAAVYKRTSFRCSAGISYNKPLAKLVCAVHKPNKQTILPPDKVELFFTTLPLRKMRNLGGKFGTDVEERLGCQTLGDLARFSLRELQRHFDEKNSSWLYNIAHGIDNEPVTVRLIPKSIGCSKNFPGKNALALKKDVEHWMHSLTTELVLRLTEDQDKNKRRAQTLTVSVSQETDGLSGSTTRSGPLPCYNVDRIVATALQLIAKSNTAAPSSLSWIPPIRHIGLSAGKFTDDCTSQKKSIQSFFKSMTKDDFYSTSRSSPISGNNSESSLKSECATIFTESKERRLNSEHHLSSVGESLLMSVNGHKHSFLDNFFKQSGRLSNTHCNRGVSSDAPMNETDVESDSHSQGNWTSERVVTKKNRDIECSSSRQFHIQDQPQGRSDISEPAVCPEKLEDVVVHSFFARYILAMKRAREDKTGLSTGTASSTSHKNFTSHPILNHDKSGDRCPEIEGTDDCGSLEKCGECGEFIPLQEFPEHVDYHSALNLQRELNDQLTPSDANVPGTSSRTYCNGQITRYSNDSSSRDSEVTAPENEAKSDTPVEKCSYCDKLIPLNEFPEHIDYHSALDLQKELNKIVPPPVTSTSSTSMKRKKSRSSKLVPSPAKKVKSVSIASFFNPK